MLAKNNFFVFSYYFILKEIKSVKEQIETCPDSRAELKGKADGKGYKRSRSQDDGLIWFKQRFYSVSKKS